LVKLGIDCSFIGIIIIELVYCGDNKAIFVEKKSLDLATNANSFIGGLGQLGGSLYFHHLPEVLRKFKLLWMINRWFCPDPIHDRFGSKVVG